MGFYKEKRNAVALIDEMFSQHKTETEIIFKVETMFGFSEKFVKKRIALVEKVLKKEEQDKAE